MELGSPDVERVELGFMMLLGFGLFFLWALFLGAKGLGGE